MIIQSKCMAQGRIPTLSCVYDHSDTRAVFANSFVDWLVGCFYVMLGYSIMKSVIFQVIILFPVTNDNQL